MDKPGSKLRKVGRALAGVAKWTTGILSALVLLLIGINWFDEDLSPEAKALLVVPPNPYKPEENLYLALLGFDAKGASPIAAGEARVAAYERELVVALKDPQYSFDPSFDHGGEEREKLKFQGKIDFCHPLTGSCLAGVEAHKAEIQRLLKTNQELYRRYPSLFEMRGYYETATPSHLSMTAYVPSPVRQLFLANVALRARSASRSEQKTALADLRRDIRIWRLELAGSGSLLSAFIAVANLQGDYGLLADIIADPRIDMGDLSGEIMSALDTPEADWRIGKVFAYEYRFSAFLWDQMRVAKELRLALDPASSERSVWDRIGDRIAFLFLKVNATQNLDAKIKTRLQGVADAGPAEFFAARDAYRAWFRDNAEMGLNYIYNPLGKFLMGAGPGTYDNYFLRAYDGAAFQRLVRLGYEMRRQKIEDGAIPSFMQRHPQWASHPVDGKLFVWDETKREIRVQTLAEQPKDRRFSIPVWRKPA